MATRRTGFTLIELLVVLSIIAILVGILLPTVAMVRKRALQVGCMSNMKQIGLVMEMYMEDSGDVFPVARYMPPPIAGIDPDPDPPLTFALRHYIDPGTSSSHNKAYRCPGDGDVWAVSGMSYDYRGRLGGNKVIDLREVRRWNRTAADIWVSRDFDNVDPLVLDGGEMLSVGFFHDERNILFADWHVSHQLQ